MNFVIGVPVWGEWYTKIFLQATLPSLNAALESISGKARFVIHTDKPESFADAKFKGDVEFYPVPIGRELYLTFGNCHRELLELADDGDAIVFMTADIIVSQECFINSEKRFDEGKRAIIITAARTLATPEECPIGAKSQDLLAFSFNHLHPVTGGCYWGAGRNIVTWAVYFKGEHGTVLRAFHLHPMVVLNDRPLYFNRETVDLDLLDRFEKNEIHVVTDPTEMSFAEISGLNKSIPQGQEICINSVVGWAKGNTTPIQRWLFSHKILISGTADDHLDEAPATEILGILG